MQKILTKKKWLTLFYVSCHVLAFPDDTFARISGIPQIGARDISKSELAAALVTWRVTEVVEDETFTWPNFTTRSRGRPAGISRSYSSPAQASGESTLHITPFTAVQRNTLLAQVRQGMTYSTALGIGHIHRALCEPIEDNSDGRAKLIKKLNSRTLDALKFVCIDINHLPSESVRKHDLIQALVAW
ncbi:hypothetical protein MPER_15944, partial [Moniliophthora perniciosa FA553]